MKIELLFFGQLKDIVGCQNIEFEHNGDIASLKEILYQRFPSLKNSKFSVAMNNRLVMDHNFIEQNAEIAFMPPFSGG